MSWIRWSWAVALASGCAASAGDDDSPSADSTGATTQATGAADAPGLSASETSAPGSADASATGLPATDGDDSGDDEAGDDAFATGGPSSPCIGDGIALADVVIDVRTNQVFGEDAAVAFDPEVDWACVENIDGMVRLRVQHGPPLFGEPGSMVLLAVYDGARIYDLATDPDPPGSGNAGLIELSYNVPFEPAGIAVFDTVNTAATGTVDVIALPTGGGVHHEFHATGEIGGSDGWVFDLHFSGTVPVE